MRSGRRKRLQSSSFPNDGSHERIGPIEPNPSLEGSPGFSLRYHVDRQTLMQVLGLVMLGVGLAFVAVWVALVVVGSILLILGILGEVLSGLAWVEIEDEDEGDEGDDYAL